MNIYEIMHTTIAFSTADCTLSGSFTVNNFYIFKSTLSPCEHMYILFQHR